MSTAQLLFHNTRLLQQAVQMLKQVPDDLYGVAHPPHLESGIGLHLRHVIDHYRCFVRDVASGKIDFDERERETRLETDRKYAIQVLQQMNMELSGIDLRDAPINIKMDSDADGKDDSAWTQSTVDRELQYLAAHTVHHYALIAVLMHLHGLKPAPTFGVAPSTLRHRKK